MVHAEREGPLFPRHLVLVELERIDRAAAELVVYREGFEDGRQEDTGMNALGMFRN
jgi:hypothetical protein